MAERWESGPPPHLRERLKKLADGCEVCGAVSWRALPDVPGRSTAYANYECGECGNVFGVPVVAVGNQ